MNGMVFVGFKFNSSWKFVGKSPVIVEAKIGGFFSRIFLVSI
jgi:hypothetical protein